MSDDDDALKIVGAWREDDGRPIYDWSDLDDGDAFRIEIELARIPGETDDAYLARGRAALNRRFRRRPSWWPGWAP